MNQRTQTLLTFIVNLSSKTQEDRSWSSSSKFAFVFVDCQNAKISHVSRTLRTYAPAKEETLRFRFGQLSATTGRRARSDRTMVEIYKQARRGACVCACVLLPERFQLMPTDGREDAFY